MQVMLMRLMSKGEYLIVPKGTKFTGSGKLGLTINTELGYDFELISLIRYDILLNLKNPSLGCGKFAKTLVLGGLLSRPKILV